MPNYLEYALESNNSTVKSMSSGNDISQSILTESAGDKEGFLAVEPAKD